MKPVRDTPSSDGTCVYEVSSNYLERIKSYDPEEQKVTIFDLKVVRDEKLWPGGANSERTDGRADALTEW
jgi:hypothetical protein